MPKLDNSAAPANTLSRRQLLKSVAIVSGGMAVGIQLSGCANAPFNNQLYRNHWRPNAWLKVHQNNRIEFILDRVEMGQNAFTGLACLIAEELEVAPEAITVSFAPVHAIYRNPRLGLQVTGASTSSAAAWLPLRQAAATTRLMLLEAAAKKWQVKTNQLRAENGHVLHPSNGQRFSYGELSSLAVDIKPPKQVKLKQAQDFKVIGKHNRRLDARAKVLGQADYGIDIIPDNTIYAVVSRPAEMVSKALRINEQHLKTLPGVIAVFEIERGIAVVAEHYWQARQAQQALVVEWQAPGELAASSEAVFDYYRSQLTEGKAKHIRSHGNADKALKRSDQLLQAIYQQPFLAHATMEPQNCVAWANKEGMTIWAPTQAPDIARVVAAKHSRYSPDEINVHTTFLGGGFGRRLTQDFVAEAAAISDRLQRPVKLQWSREEDMQHDWYRPASLHELKASVDQNGNIQAWQHQVVCPGIFDWFVKDAAAAQYPWLPKAMYDTAAAMGKAGEGIIAPKDTSAYEGADNFPYHCDHFALHHIKADAGVPVSYWRSVGYSHNAFVIETFMDELAEHANQDPFSFRLNLLTQHPEAIAVLQQAANMANWSSRKEREQYGKFQGIALQQSFSTWVAQVVEIRYQPNQDDYQIEKVFCAVNCGQVINPDTVVAQMEGGIIFGLTAARYGEIALQQQQVIQSNFHDYPLLRVNETPDIEVRIIKSDNHPTGVGEPGVPPAAPALANAIYAATGKRYRQLPIRKL